MIVSAFSANATPSLPAMNPEEVQSLFVAWLDIFDPIWGQPTDADLTRSCKELMTILLPLPYYVEKGIHNFMGLIMDKENYKQRYLAKFTTPTKPSVYNLKIPNSATNLVRAKAEAVHTAKIVDCLLFAVAECETRDFILMVVEDTWLRKLCDPVTLYTTVVPYELLDHLQTLCGGLHSLDLLALQNEIQHYSLEMEAIPEYVNALKDAQKQSKRSGNPITADTLLPIATNSMMSN